MSPKDQQLAIAKAYGITNIKPDPHGWGGGPDVKYVGESSVPFVGWYCAEPKTPRFIGRIPDYLNDLNAIFQAIGSRSMDEQWVIFATLAAIVDSEKPAFMGTPAQYSQAFLQTLGLWEDSK